MNAANKIIIQNAANQLAEAARIAAITGRQVFAVKFSEAADSLEAAFPEVFAAQSQATLDVIREAGVDTESK